MRNNRRITHIIRATYTQALATTESITPARTHARLRTQNDLCAQIHGALPPHGALLIAEMLLDADGLGPEATLLQSLNMLVQTEGRERTPAEFDALLRAAGFARVDFKRTGLPLDAVIAYKS